VSVIDFRARPNTPEFARYLARRQVAITAGSGTFVTHRAPEETLEEFIAQLDRVGIQRAVFGARNRASDGDWTLTSDFVAACVEAYPDRLVGFAGIDLGGDLDAAEEDVRHAIEDLGLFGVTLDPFRLDGGGADDPRLDPIYELCVQLRAPVIVTLGGWPGIEVPLRHAHPFTIDEVAGRFPELVIIATHAGWPFPLEMVAVAWRRENVYFDNSPYHVAAGASVLVDAANSMVGHKFLYASAYPFAPLEESLRTFRALPFDPDVRENVLFNNADALLRRISAEREAAGLRIPAYA
jgi:predicted TIM-barrel fold metal-dependent hydrolase